MVTEQAVEQMPFSMKTPLLSAGNSFKHLADTSDLWLHVKVYAEGGENALHAHTTEDHAFVVLEGQATFFAADGSTTVVGKNEGMMLPKGALYNFQSSGEGNLVMLRVGTGVNGNPYKKIGEDDRIGPDGNALPGHDPANKTGAIPGVPVPGKFFAADAPD